MALSGSFTVFSKHLNNTEIISHSVSYPLEVPEGHEFYALRGTTQIVSQSIPVQVSTTYNNQYVVIKGAAISKHKAEFGAHYEWEGYDNVSASRNSNEPGNFSGSGAFIFDWSMYTNVYEEAYNDLSSSFLSSNITNV